MNQRGLQCALKGERANVHPYTLEAPLMRLSVASLRRVVKRDLPIEFVPLIPSTGFEPVFQP
jgi:hypothetical protein